MNKIRIAYYKCDILNHDMLHDGHAGYYKARELYELKEGLSTLFLCKKCFSGYTHEDPHNNTPTLQDWLNIYLVKQKEKEEITYVPELIWTGKVVRFHLVTGQVIEGAVMSTPSEVTGGAWAIELADGQSVMIKNYDHMSMFNEKEET